MRQFFDLPYLSNKNSSHDLEILVIVLSLHLLSLSNSLSSQFMSKTLLRHQRQT
jgi:hypothetical protein